VSKSLGGNELFVATVGAEHQTSNINVLRFIMLFLVVHVEKGASTLAPSVAAAPMAVCFG